MRFIVDAHLPMRLVYWLETEDTMSFILANFHLRTKQLTYRSYGYP